MKPWGSAVPGLKLFLRAGSGDSIEGQASMGKPPVPSFMPRSDRLERQARVLLFGLSAAAGAVAILAVLGFRLYRERDRMVEHTLNVISRIEELRRAVRRAQTAVLDHALGQPGQAAVVEEAGAGARRSSAELTRLTRDNSPQADLVREISAQIDGLIAAGRDLAGSAPESGPSLIAFQRQTAELIDDITRAQAEERRLLSLRTGDRRVIENRLAMAFVLVFAINAALLWWSIAFARSYRQARDGRDRALNRLNAGLESKVAERTRELERTVGELRRSNEDLRRFANSASHDLQEPVRVIGSYVSLIEKRFGEKLDGDGALYLARAINGAKQLQRLLSDILAYASLRESEPTRYPAPLARTLEAALESLRLQIEDSGATIRASGLPEVDADHELLRRVFQALISNAIKFAAPGRPPVVEVSANRSETEWTVEVRDNGIGFEEEFSESIFSLFSRLHPRGRYEGSGTGLATALRIVELHHGRMGARSKPGEGSVFFFTLPSPNESLNK